jgi:hypothetical protein
VIKLKDPKDLIYSAFQVCEIEGCKKESEKIWASSEIRIVDICKEHFDQLQLERDIT